MARRATERSITMVLVPKPLSADEVAVAHDSTVVPDLTSATVPVPRSIA